MQSLFLDLFLKFQTIFCMPEWVDNLFCTPVEWGIEQIMDISGFTKPLSALKMISNATSANSIYYALWSTVQTIVTKTVLPIGVALTVTFFILSLIDMASKDNTTLEHYIKEFIKLIIAVTVVKNSWPIILYLIKIGDTVLLSLYDESKVAMDAVKENVDELVNVQSVAASGGYACLLLVLLIPLLVKWLAIVAMYVCVFMRALDIGWRAVMFPIGSSNLFEGGINSPGVKYIKGFFGSLLSGSVVMAIMLLCPSLLSAAFTLGCGKSGLGVNNLTLGLLAMTGAEIAIVGAAFGASNKTKEIFS